MLDRIITGTYIASPALIVAMYVALYVKQDPWAVVAISAWSIPVWAAATTFLILEDVRYAALAAAIVALVALGHSRCNSRRPVGEIDADGVLSQYCNSFASVLTQPVAYAAGIGAIIALVILGMRGDLPALLGRRG